MTLRRAIIVFVTGSAIATLAAWNLQGSVVGAAQLTGRASGGALLVGLIGALSLQIVQGRSLMAQLTIVTFTTVAALAAGAVAAGNAILATSRPFASLVVVLAAAGTVGILVGLLLAARVQGASELLAETARDIGRGGSASPLPDQPTEELGRLAEELESTSRRLEESRAHAASVEAARRELVTWISHDLRTPLARIRAVVEALEDGVIEADGAAEFHRRLRLDTDRLSGLVDGLFELSRIHAGSMELSLQPTRLGDLVSDLVAAFAALSGASGVQLHAHLRGPDPVVEASMEHLERALSNLLDNSIRYSSPGSSVRVEVGTAANKAYVSIEDACGGVSAEDLERLLGTPLGRSREQGRHPNSGTGLGLAIAKGLIDAHGGTIGVEDLPDGCRFDITLPLAASYGNGETTKPRAARTE
ncbi:MAG: HAMP domain-containing histidine kinase [Actinobacteria bacterium]|nr:HAMP domain-containing histidine kinase [Actinomycetota bacterium]